MASISRAERAARQTHGRRIAPQLARTPRLLARPAPAVALPCRNQGMVARVFGHHASPELLGLWLVEATLCGILIYIVLTAGGGPALQLQAANQAIVLALTIGLASFTIGLYSSEPYFETRRLITSTALAGVLAFPAIWVVGTAIGVDLPGMARGEPLLPLAALAGWTLFVGAVRLAFSYALRMNLFVRRVIVIAADHGTDPAAERLLAMLHSLRRGVFELVSVLPAREAAKLTSDVIRTRKVWGIIITADARAALAADLPQAWQACRVYGDAEFWESQLRRIDIDHPAAAGRPNAYGERAGGHGGERLDAALNRAADLLLSLILMGVTLPLMLLTALLIKLDSPGPVLYRQERVGLRGHPFTVLKFRSMRVDAEARGPVWASQRDPRVTRIGGFIRAARIDELPQLFNVLRGEMSFIGPRPERPHFVAHLAEVVPLYRERSRVKPGLTGWAQVNYPYGASVEDARNKLSYDLYYVKHRNILLDVLILFSTVRVVLFQQGAR
jgi:exopolysaccharide biosynthesis polyprenyl glycosylphosphotransferase